MNNFHQLPRGEFRGLLDATLHPSMNIFLPDQLKGRAKPLLSILDCFETPGAQAFIWGPRGAGKTSLGHTSCEVHSGLVKFAAAIACDRNTTLSNMMNDILRSVVQGNKISLKNKNLSGTLSAFGVKISANMEGFTGNLDVSTPNEAEAILNSVFSINNFPDRTPVVIVDEFDLLRNEDTHRDISGLLKQLSVGGLRLKFVFCGVARDLNELLGSHESVERYVYGIELKPLPDDAMWEIIADTESVFGVKFSRGQQVRIGQISAIIYLTYHLAIPRLMAYRERDATDGYHEPDLHRRGQGARASGKAALAFGSGVPSLRCCR